MMMNCPTLADFIGGCCVDFLDSVVGIVDSVVPFVMVCKEVFVTDIQY